MARTNCSKFWAFHDPDTFFWQCSEQTNPSSELVHQQAAATVFLRPLGFPPQLLTPNPGLPPPGRRLEGRRRGDLPPAPGVGAEERAGGDVRHYRRLGSVGPVAANFCAAVAFLAISELFRSSTKVGLGRLLLGSGNFVDGQPSVGLCPCVSFLNLDTGKPSRSCAGSDSHFADHVTTPHFPKSRLHGPGVLQVPGVPGALRQPQVCRCAQRHPGHHQGRCKKKRRVNRSTWTCHFPSLVVGRVHVGFCFGRFEGSD